MLYAFLAKPTVKPRSRMEDLYPSVAIYADSGMHLHFTNDTVGQWTDGKLENKKLEEYHTSLDPLCGWIAGLGRDGQEA